jgi:transcriptional regulator with XRE-family HTH domain
MDKVRAAAQELYLTGWTQAEIARTLKVSENTISKWSAQMKWGEKKTRYNLLEENSLQMLMSVFDYQATCLYKIVEQRIENDNYEPLQGGIFDALNKAYKPIEPQFKDFKAYAKITRELLDHIQANNIQIAKDVEPIVSQFLNEKRNLL